MPPLAVISGVPWGPPSGAQRGMQCAPIAALSAVVLPEILMTKGIFIHTWADARIFGALAGAAYFFWRRGSAQAVLGTIVAGMSGFIPLHFGLSWGLGLPPCRRRFWFSFRQSFPKKNPKTSFF